MGQLLFSSHAEPFELERVPSLDNLALNPSPSGEGRRHRGRVGLPQQSRKHQRRWNHEEGRDRRHFRLEGMDVVTVASERG